MVHVQDDVKRVKCCKTYWNPVERMNGDVSVFITEASKF